MTTGYELGSAEYRRVTLALFLAGFVTFALLYETQPVLPQLAHDFTLTPSSAALSVSVTTIGLGLSLLAAGPLSEVRGRTPLMFASLFASSVVGITCALAPNFPVLLALRGLQGVLLAGLPAVAVAYLAEEMTPKAQASATGIYVGGTALGGMAARLANAALTGIWGWRASLLALGVACLVSSAFVYRLLPRSRGFTPAPASVGHLRAQTRLLLRDRAMVALFAIGGVSMGAFVGLFNAITFRLQGDPYHLTVGAAGLVYVVYALGSYTSARAGRAVASFGQRAVAPWCALVMLAGVVASLVTPLPIFVGAIAIVSAGFFALHSVVSGWVAARATISTGAPGQASSGYLFTYYAGSSLFGALAGVALSHAGWPGVVAMCSALVGTAYLLTLYVRRIPSLRETEHPDPGSAAY